MRGVTCFYRTSNNFVGTKIKKLDSILGVVELGPVVAFMYILPSVFLVAPLLIAFLERDYPFPILRWAAAIALLFVDLLVANIVAKQAKWWDVFRTAPAARGLGMTLPLWWVCWFVWMLNIPIVKAIPGTR